MRMLACKFSVQEGDFIFFWFKRHLNALLLIELQPKSFQYNKWSKEKQKNFFFSSHRVSIEKPQMILETIKQKNEKSYSLYRYRSTRFLYEEINRSIQISRWIWRKTLLLFEAKTMKIHLAQEAKKKFCLELVKNASFVSFNEIQYWGKYS